MTYSELVDTLLDEMYRKDLAQKEVEFCTENNLGLVLLSIYENNGDGVNIAVGTKRSPKTQTVEKIILDWGRAGKGQPPNTREIKNTLRKIKEEAQISNTFSLYGVSAGMLEYLKNHLDPENAVIKEVRTGWILIGIDEKTVQALYDSI